MHRVWLAPYARKKPRSCGVARSLAVCGWSQIVDPGLSSKYTTYWSNHPRPCGSAARCTTTSSVVGSKSMSMTADKVVNYMLLNTRDLFIMLYGFRQLTYRYAHSLWYLKACHVKSGCTLSTVMSLSHDLISLLIHTVA